MTGIVISLLLVSVVIPLQDQEVASTPPESRFVSGIYPHLAMFNQHRECGVGAIVPWAGSLWCLTYPPHFPNGSTDGLYRIDGELRLHRLDESVGGTHANRLIHRETQQLVIGPYVIDAAGHVRVIEIDQLVGRLTATARHLEKPERLVYFVEMEGAVYEVDLKSLDVKRLFKKPVPGWHGKGATTTQGRLIVTNNGESDPSGGTVIVGDHDHRGEPASDEDAGALATWDGRRWVVWSRRPHTEVTGPGGLGGATSEDEPAWALGWDRRSGLLRLLDDGEWSTFRLPKASFTYDGRHGWHTEWPRIREIGRSRFLADTRGTLFDLPGGFRRGATAGLRPIANHLKMFVDFCAWGDRLVFACNDASLFDNALVGQAQSNLWFSSADHLSEDLGPALGWGGPWLGDDVEAEQSSDPFLFAGYSNRVLHLTQRGPEPVTFTVEVDASGQGVYEARHRITVPPGAYRWLTFEPTESGEWVRLRVDRSAADVQAVFMLTTEDTRPARSAALFSGLAERTDDQPWLGGIVRPRGGSLGTLHGLIQCVDPLQRTGIPSYFELDAGLSMSLPDDPEAGEWLAARAAVKESDLLLDEDGAHLSAGGSRFLLPVLDLVEAVLPERREREVVTERSLLHIGGTFYEKPRENSGGLWGLRPVATHGKRITDFCSWRGLLVLVGVRADAEADGHVVRTEDGQAAVWLGNVDDLWKLGKPRGSATLWRSDRVDPAVPSEALLMYGYDRKRLELSLAGERGGRVTVEADVTGRGRWVPYASFELKSGTPITHQFPEGYQARWVRLVAHRELDGVTARMRYD